MPHDGFHEVAGTSVVQEVGMSVYLLLQTDTPERCGAPFVATGQTTHEIVVQAHTHNLRAHIMKQIV